jgi:hypothetical protein
VVTGDLLALLSFVVLAASMGGWVVGMQKVRLEGKRGLFIASFSVAFVLSLLAFTQGPGLLGAMAAGFSLLGSGIFLGLAALGRQEPKEPAVAVGSPVIDFSAPLDDDTLFDSNTLRGRPFLLKFFRGHW